MNEIWAAYETDGCEADWAIGYFWSKESAIKCARDAYYERVEEMKTGHKGESHMQWPDEPYVADDGKAFMKHPHGSFNPGFYVCTDPIEVLP